MQTRMLQPILALVVVLGLNACQSRTTLVVSDLGSPGWCHRVESQVSIVDAQGHGPDIGSGEWMSALNHRLGITDPEGHGPDIGSPEWLHAVDRKVFGE